ncbi:MAG: hypothetical protein GVY13_09530 [Alphaproteobacteria bacterium]|jgi:hypothetical protein|nr:hypothetical protein [Alphaproteobacteria bacterium]
MISNTYDYHINWHSQIEELKPFLNGQGGVIAIEVDENRSAPEKFVGVLTRLLDSKGAFSLRVNSQDSRTHYPEDIIANLEHRLGLGQAPSTDVKSILKNAEVACNNEAGRDMNIDLDIGVGLGQYGSSNFVIERTGLIVKAIEEVLADKQVCLFLVQSHRFDARVKDWLWPVLWRDGLLPFIQQGLVLIDVYDERAETRQRHWARPPANRILNLPPKYDRQDRIHAHRDIKEIILRELPDYDEPRADMRAQYLLEDLNYEVSDVHIRLAALIAQSVTP